MQKYNTIIEYDSSGHWYGVKHYQITLDEFTKLEHERELKLINKGYYIIRFISKNDKLPLDNTILNIIGHCINLLLDKLNNAKIIKINIDNEKIYFNNQLINIDLGKIRNYRRDYYCSI